MTISGRAFVSLGIVIFMGVFLYTAYDYNAKARLLPVLVTGTILVMALIQLLGELFPRLRRFMPFLEQESLLVNDRTRGVSNDVRDILDEGTPASVATAQTEDGGKADAALKGPPDTWLTPVLCVVAMAGLLVMFRFLPYWVAVPVFLFVMLFGLGRQGPVLSLVVSVVTGSALFVLFDLILQARL